MLYRKAHYGRCSCHNFKFQFIKIPLHNEASLCFPNEASTHPWKCINVDVFLVISCYFCCFLFQNLWNWWPAINDWSEIIFFHIFVIFENLKHCTKHENVSLFDKTNITHENFLFTLLVCPQLSTLLENILTSFYLNVNKWLFLCLKQQWAFSSASGWSYWQLQFSFSWANKLRVVVIQNTKMHKWKEFRASS